MKQQKLIAVIVAIVLLGVFSLGCTVVYIILLKTPAENQEWKTSSDCAYDSLVWAITRSGYGNVTKFWQYQKFNVTATADYFHAEGFFAPSYEKEFENKNGTESLFQELLAYNGWELIKFNLTGWEFIKFDRVYFHPIFKRPVYYWIAEETVVDERLRGKV
jgi:hypothetical protein